MCAIQVAGCGIGRWWTLLPDGDSECELNNGRVPVTACGSVLAPSGPRCRCAQVVSKQMRVGAVGIDLQCCR